MEKDKGNLHITMQCSFADELKIDQSVAHNGVCLTVVKVDKENVLLYSNFYFCTIKAVVCER